MYSQLHSEVCGRFLGTRLRFPVMETELHIWHTNSQRIDPNLSRNNPADFCKICCNIIFYSSYNDSVILFYQILLRKVITKMPLLYSRKLHVSVSVNHNQARLKKDFITSKKIKI